MPVLIMHTKTGRMNSRYKSGGINFANGQLYWASDANGPTPHDRGIFLCDPADLADPEKHTMLFNPKYESANMIIEDGVILSAHYAPASTYHTGFIISTNMVKTWAQYDLKQFGRRSPVRFHKKNSDGWFRVDSQNRMDRARRGPFYKAETVTRRLTKQPLAMPMESNQ